MVTIPTSPNSSRRSLARTSAVSTPSVSRTSSVSRMSAPRGTAMVSPFRPTACPSAWPPLRRSPPPLPSGVLPDERDVDALDVERPAARRQLAPEAAEQVVVAAAAAERHAERAVVDLEDRARVVAQRARHPEVEDDPPGRPGREPLVQAPQAAHRVGRRPRGQVEHLRAAAELRQAQEQVRGLVPHAQAAHLAREPDEVAG